MLCRQKKNASWSYMEIFMSTLDKQLNTMQPKMGFRPKYRLRWRFDFAGRPSRIGGWNATSQDPKEMAWAVKKEHLVRASIEGEKNGEWIVKTLLEVDGHDYASMRWVGNVSLGGWQPGKFVRAPDVVGLTIMTASTAATVFIDGTGQAIPLTEYEKKFKLTEHRS